LVFVFLVGFDFIAFLMLLKGQLKKSPNYTRQKQRLTCPGQLTSIGKLFFFKGNENITPKYYD
jgi:hypothetical protein